MITKSVKYKIIAAVALVYGLFLASEGWGVSSKRAFLEKNGVTAPGVIEGTRIQTSGSGRRRSTDYILAVSFKTPAGARKAEFDVTLPFFESKTSGPGPSVTVINPNAEVRYLEADPQTAMIVGGSVDRSYKLWFGLVVSGLGVCGLIYLLVRKPF